MNHSRFARFVWWYVACVGLVMIVVGLSHIRLPTRQPVTVAESKPECPFGLKRIEARIASNVPWKGKYYERFDWYVSQGSDWRTAQNPEILTMQVEDGDRIMVRSRYPWGWNFGYREMLGDGWEHDVYQGYQPELTKSHCTGTYPVKIQGYAKCQLIEIWKIQKGCVS